MKKYFIFVIAVFLSKGLLAAETLVAVAGNFSAPMEKLMVEFQNETGDRVRASYGATGVLVAQIKAGAPYEILLAADQGPGASLEKAHLLVTGEHFVYAIGRLVLWSADSKLVDSQGQVLGSELRFRHLAIANPEVAPYGKAAQQVLQNRGLWEKLKGKMVHGENITQTFQFVSTGHAELGFVALSQTRDSKGSAWLVPQDLYTPLKQEAYLLLKGQNSDAARRFLKFLKSPKGIAIIKDFGYGFYGTST